MVYITTTYIAKVKWVVNLTVIQRHSVQVSIFAWLMESNLNKLNNE